MWDEVLLSSIEIKISYYKDPVINQPGFFMECHEGGS